MSTQAYVDLMFAWGHARLGDAETTHRLAREAAERLHPVANAKSPYPQIDPAHSWLLDAFTFRIEEASRGRPPGGPWPAELQAGREALDDPRSSNFSRGYVVDRLRAVSRILESVDDVDPYAPWMSDRLAVRAAIRRVIETSSEDLARRIGEFCDENDHKSDWLDRLEFYRSLVGCDNLGSEPAGAAVLDRARALAVLVLDRGWNDHPDAAALFARHRPRPVNADKGEIAHYEADAANPGRWLEGAMYINAAGLFRWGLRTAGRMRLRSAVRDYLDDVLRLSRVGHPAAYWVIDALYPLSRYLVQLDLHEEARRLSDELRDSQLAGYSQSRRVDQLIAAAGLAGIDLWLDRPDRAGEVFDRLCEDVRSIGQPASAIRLAVAYLEVLRPLAWPDRQSRVEAILAALPRVPNSYTTSPWYSRSHLEVVDRVVQTTASAGSMPGTPVPIPADEIAARREALVDLRAKLVRWGQTDWSR
jgi:hypothetical protein